MSGLQTFFKVLFSDSFNYEDYITSVLDERVWSIRGTDGKTELLQGKPVSVSVCPPRISQCLGVNLGLCGERLVTNYLSHGTTSVSIYSLPFSKKI